MTEVVGVSERYVLVDKAEIEKTLDDLKAAEEILKKNSDGEGLKVCRAQIRRLRRFLS